MSIKVNNVSKRFHNDFTVLDNVSLEIGAGELVALLGPSGSGKTTLLRIIAGLETADTGTILFDGKAAHSVQAHNRHVGFVFQHYALFKHMTVFANVAFGLKVSPRPTRPSKQHIKAKVMELLRLVHLEAFHSHYPHQLSGGQRQRVALARALAVNPKVLLLDEPFGALDAKVRKELRRWMRRLHDELGVTSIFVTHDQEEAMEVADRVVVMDQGRIKQIGTPEEVWQHPVDRFVYNFLGNYNEFDGWRDGQGNIHISDTVNTNGSANMVKLFARPHEIYLTKTPDNQEYIMAKVIHINPAGALVKLELIDSNNRSIQAEITVTDMLNLKAQLGDMLYIRPTQVKVFVD